MFGIEFRKLLEKRVQPLGQQAHLGLGDLDRRLKFDFGTQISVRFLGTETVRARSQPFDQNLDVSVRQFEALHDSGNRAGRENVLRRRVVLGGIHLGGQINPLVALQRFLQSHRRRMVDR